MALNRVNQHPQAVEILGQPVESGLLVTGEIKITGPKGNADISFSVSGPKGEGTVYASAVLEAGKWRMTGLILEADVTGKRLDLLTSRRVDSTESGYQEAMRAYEKRDFATALKLLTPLAEKGDGAAQDRLGIMSLHGIGVAKDIDASLRWFNLAADQKHAEAQNNLGFVYSQGLGVPKDLAAAFKWFRLAADQGHTQAQNNMGIMHANKIGVERDFITAYRWFSLADQQRYKGAKTSLAELEAQMTPEQVAQAKRPAGEKPPKEAPETKQVAAKKPEAPKDASRRPGKKPRTNPPPPQKRSENRLRNSGHKPTRGRPRLNAFLVTCT